VIEMNEFRFDKSIMRPGQLAAFMVTMQRIRDGLLTASNVLPTRYGKSDAQRLTQMQLHADRIVCGTLQLTTGLYLVRQFVSDAEVLEMAKRYCVSPMLATKIRHAQPDDEWFCNNEYCVAMTVQMATQNARIVVQNAQQWADKIGLPVHLCMDECDETVFGRSRGNLVEMWLKAGMPLSMWTALAVREDGERVPGFEYEEIGSKDGVRVESHPEIQQDGEVKRRVNTIAGRRVQIRIKANHETTFREAWGEIPSPLCHLNRLVVDVDLEDDEGTPIGKLSEQSESVSRAALGKATMNDAAISQGVRYLLHDMKQNRAADERCTAIVFTGNDRPEVSNEDNFHAKLVESKIHELSAECGFRKKLRVVVATVKKEQKIADLLEDFVAGRGGDVLVVKQAAGRGLTAPHLKTLLDLSSVRKARSYVQRLMRVATPFHSIKTATVITLADKVGGDLWKTYIQDQGGECDPDMVQFVDDELIRTKLVDIEELTDEAGVSIAGASLQMFDDSMGLFGSAAQYPLVAKIVEALPESKARRTLAEIAKALHDAGVDITQSEVLRTASAPVGLGSEIKQLQEAIKAKAKAVVEQSVPYQGVGSDSYEIYVQANRDIYAAAKRAAGVAPQIKLESITNVKTLKAIDAYMEARVRETQTTK
jgi:hypothetical protein